MDAVVDGSRLSPQKPLMFSYGLPAMVRLRLVDAHGGAYPVEAESFALDIVQGSGQDAVTLLHKEYDASAYNDGELQFAFTVSSEYAYAVLCDSRMAACRFLLTLNNGDAPSPVLEARCVVALAVQQPDVADTPIEEAVETVIEEPAPEPPEEEPPQETEPEELAPEPVTVPVQNPPTPVDIQRVAQILQGYYDDTARDYALRAEEAARNASLQAGASETAANNAATVAAVRLEQLVAEYAAAAIDASSTASMAASAAADSAVTAIAAASGAQAASSSAMEHAATASLMAGSASQSALLAVRAADWAYEIGGSASAAAAEAQASAGDAFAAATSASVWAEGSHDAIVVLGGTFSAKGWSEQAQSHAQDALEQAQHAELRRIAKPYCFASLFANAADLLSAPELPATELSEGCYMAMFMGSGISKAPSLPATRLATRCYAMMFAQSAVAEAPALPAIELAPACYAAMFGMCPYLEAAPYLPARKPAAGCYGMMFIQSSVTSVSTGLTEWGETDPDAGVAPTTNWLAGVPASGTFICPAELDTTMRGGDTVPEGWTVVNT